MSDMADFAVDFGEPNPVVVPRTYTEAEVREAQAVALEEAADAQEATEDMYSSDAQWVKGRRKAIALLRARAVTVRGGE